MCFKGAGDLEEGWKRDGLEAARKKRGTLGTFQTAVGGLWMHQQPPFGGVPGKQCFGAQRGLTEQEGIEPGFTEQVE